MYSNDRTHLRVLHPLVSRGSGNMPKQSDEEKGEPLVHGPIDPFCEQILSMALSLLEIQDQITIKDLLDVLEEKGIQASDSVVRERVSELVDRGELECLPGSGRRPSYYFSSSKNENGNGILTDTQPRILQVEYATPDDAEALQHLLDVVSQLQSEVDSIQEQLSKKLDDLASVQEDIDAFRRVVKIKMRLGSNESINDGGQ